MVSRDPWMPERSFEERIARAVDSLIPGSGRGRIAQAMRVKDRPMSSVDSLDDEISGGFVLAEQHRHVVISEGDQFFELDHLPVTHSEHLYWNGHYQEGTEWTRAQYSVTVPDPEGIFEPGDVLVMEYLYEEGSVKDVTPPIFAAGGTVDGFVMPAGAQAGDLLIAVVMLSSNDTITNYNGYQVIKETDNLTHGSSSGSWTYKMVVLSRKKPADSDPVPTIGSGSGQSPAILMAVRGVNGVTGCSTNTVADGTSASAPGGVASAQIRAFGTISSLTTITPSQGEVIFNLNYNDIDLVTVQDSDPSSVSASTGGNAGWHAATIGVA